MKKHSYNYDGPYGTCNKCGWSGHDWAFKYQGLCSDCYKEWKKEKRETLRKLKPPNDDLEITKGVIVTRNVKERLLKQSYSDIPHIKHYELMDWSGVIATMTVAILIGLAVYTSNTAFVIGVPVIIVLGIYIEIIKNKKEKEREDQINTHLKKLAVQRKTQIEEAQLFYTSAEWRLIRSKVIKQQGKICKECGQIIKNSYDITVDHIKPRSVYPGESLNIDNLRVLCRSCNSKKGDDIINESDILLDT